MRTSDFAVLWQNVCSAQLHICVSVDRKTAITCDLAADQIPTTIWKYFFFFRFPNLFAICIDTFKYNQQIVC
jgi:hypothetical protein